MDEGRSWFRGGVLGNLLGWAWLLASGGVCVLGLVYSIYWVLREGSVDIRLHSFLAHIVWDLIEEKKGELLWEVVAVPVVVALTWFALHRLAATDRARRVIGGSVLAALLGIYLFINAMVVGVYAGFARM